MTFALPFDYAQDEKVVKYRWIMIRIIPSYQKVKKR